MKFDFDQRIDRTQSISIKWSPELRQQMYGERDIIPMGIADMDFKTAPAVAEAIQAAPLTKPTAMAIPRRNIYRRARTGRSAATIGM